MTTNGHTQLGGRESRPAKRLLVISGARIVGGAELSLIALARRLPAHGWDVVLTCPPGPLVERAAETGLAVVPRGWRVVRPISAATPDGKRYSSTRTLASTRDTAVNAFGLTRLSRSVGATAVLSNSLPTHLVVALAARLARVPPVWYLREIVDPGAGRRMLEAAGRSVPLLLSISDAVTAAIDHPRIVTIPEPVDPPDRWLPRPPLGDRGRTVVGYLGRLDPRKGVEDLCRAAAAVDADFRVAGAPLLAPTAYVDELRALADAGAPGRVEFLGAVTSPWPFLGSIDILVVPSRREPWGRVAAEALMAGVPVVASNTGGLPEIVRDGVDGLLYPPGDVDALIAHLHRLVGDDGLHARLSQAARAGAGRFDPAQHTQQVARALDQLVGVPAGS